MPIPNLKMKLRKSAPKKIYFEKTSKNSFREQLFCHAFFKFCLWIWNQSFGTQIDLLYVKKKVFSSIFLKILIGLYSYINSMVLSRSGEGDANISSKMPHTVSNLPHFIETLYIGFILFEYSHLLPHV